MSAAVDAALLARIEDAGINASAPRQQRWVDGWLVRTCPGKAKRARCIQAVGAGRTTVAEKLARCRPIYTAAGLRLYVRITPFSQPAGLDDTLAGLGYASIDDTLVLVATQLAALATASPPLDHHLESIDGAAFVEWIGTARGSSPAERAAHRERTASAPVPYEARVLRNAAGDVVAGGQVVVEDDIAGLYDVFTETSERGRGFATALCLDLLRIARERGASIGYLQVDAANAPALAVYRRLGFVDGYGYHYRSLPEAASD